MLSPGVRAAEAPTVAGSLDRDVDLRVEHHPTEHHPTEPTRPSSAFLVTGVGAYLLSLAAVVGLALVRTDGRWVFVIDDGAIHLSMADTLARHGTWGVTAGTFESASSSPLWTALLAAVSFVLPAGEVWASLALTAAAGVVVLVLLARSQDLLQPARGRPLDVAATAVLAVVVLLLPGLAVTGMEHLAHAALLLAALTLAHRLDLGTAPPGRRWAVYALLALAALTRFETLFFAVGLATALCTTAPRPRRLGASTRFAIGCLAAATVPVVAFAAVNRAMGQGYLPNSVLAKTEAHRGRAGLVPSAQDALEALATDPVVLVLVLVAATYLVRAWTGGSRRSVVPAVAFVVTALLHSAYADFGWHERYQAYLIVLGVSVALSIGAEVVPAPSRRTLLLAAAVVAVVVLPLKWATLYSVPLSSDNTYRQRYQAGRFLERYYDGQPIATGELGYPTLFHDGPVVDLLGIGTHEVVGPLSNDATDAAFWQGLVQRRGVQVVAMYPSTLRAQVPAAWSLVGEWSLGVEQTSAFETTFQFWAPHEAQRDVLRDQLLEFQPELPEGVELTCWECVRDEVG